MRLFVLLIAVTAVTALGACSSNAPPQPSYDPEPYVDNSSSQTMSLHDRVHEALELEMGSAASEIGVRAEGSKIYLTGYVSSHQDHDRAHDIAHGVSGVSSVNHDELRIH